MADRSRFDTLDYEIVRLLNENGRISASDMARLLNANERTIRKRVDRLVESGAIRLTAVVEPQAFGYWLSVDIFVQIEISREKQILDQLMGMPNVSYLAYGQGDRTISIEARFMNDREMHEFLHETLPAIEGVKVTGYTLVPLILRNVDRWLPPARAFGVREENEK